MKRREVTWMVLRERGRVLLAWKKRGFGVGKLNGVGGKVEEGEEVLAAAVREAREEIGVEVTKCEKVAEIMFDMYDGGERLEMRMHAYVASEWEGEPVEMEEMRPEWFADGDVPYGRMWGDDEFWLPRVLAGERVRGWFRFDEGDKIIDYKVEELGE